MYRTLHFITVGLLATCIPALAIAQPASGPDAVAVLKRANEAHKAARWLDYDFDYAGTFGALGHVAGRATVMPAGDLARLAFAADVNLLLPPNNLVSYPAATRLAMIGGTVYRVDERARKIDTASTSKGGIALVRPLSAFIPPQFMRGEPLGIEIDQPERHVYAGRALAGGVECDVVFLKFPAGSGLGEQYFYFGAADHLLRRLVFHNPGSTTMPPFNWDLTLSDLRFGTGEPPRPLRPSVPDGWTVEDHDAAGAAIGDAAPPWALPRRGGGRVSSSDLAGDVVVLDFWASWCPFCRQNTPGLARLQEDFRGTAVRVFAVQVWDTEDPGPALAAAGVSLDMLTGGDTLAEQLKVGGTPTAVVIGRDGRIAARIGGVGARRDEQLRAAIAAALASPSVK
jgi:thiol-disulfide isomerase/thioredoxin